MNAVKMIGVIILFVLACGWLFGWYEDYQEEEKRQKQILQGASAMCYKLGAEANAPYFDYDACMREWIEIFSKRRWR